MDIFRIPSVEAENALLSPCSSLAASILDEGQTSSSTNVFWDDSDDDDDDWDVESVFGLDNVERTGAKRRQCVFQDKYLAVKRKVLGKGCGDFRAGYRVGKSGGCCRC